MNADVVGIAVDVITAAGVIFSIIWAVRSSRSDAQAAEASARRGEAAARLQDEQFDRLTEAIGRLQLTPGSPVADRVRWSLEHHQRDAFRLTNTSETETAYGVRLKHHPTLFVQTEAVDGRDFGPGEATTFLAAPSLGTEDVTIQVRWQDRNGDDHQWKYPLPPKA